MADGWDDPFAEDEAARERERRRAEREARREERRRALADKVREERTVVAPERPAPPAQAQPTRETVADGDGSAPPPAAPPRAPMAAGGRGVPPPDVLRRRRMFGLLLVLGALAGLAVLAYGVVQVADRLGGSDDPAPAAAPKLGSITIPEGLDREQIAATVKDAGIGGDYVKATRSFRGFDPGRYGAENPESLEGFLFPATYELPRKAKVDDLISRQLDAFRDNSSRIDFGYAADRNLTKYDVVIIASMIEREVQVPEERPLVAAVIYNRLSAGMDLQIDATVRFATGNYDSPVTESELNTDSPYNTYTNSGLPPGPIGNPGLDSLKAAAKPANEDYLYYVIEPGTCNEHFFTASEAEFNQAVEDYRAAQEAAGGSPTEC
jgi:peptidoglycan lytic transglycosylase G